MFKHSLCKQLVNNFEKVHKTTFLTPKIVKTLVWTWPKVSIFDSILDLQPLKFRWQKNYSTIIAQYI